MAKTVENKSIWLLLLAYDVYGQYFFARELCCCSVYVLLQFFVLILSSIMIISCYTNSNRFFRKPNGLSDGSVVSEAKH